MRSKSAESSGEGVPFQTITVHLGAPATSHFRRSNGRCAAASTNPHVNPADIRSRCHRGNTGDASYRLLLDGPSRHCGLPSRSLRLRSPRDGKTLREKPENRQGRHCAEEQVSGSRPGQAEPGWNGSGPRTGARQRGPLGPAHGCATTRAPELRAGPQA